MCLTQQAQLSCPHRPPRCSRGYALDERGAVFVTRQGYEAQGDGACAAPGGEESLGILVHLSPGGWSRGGASNESLADPWCWGARTPLRLEGLSDTCALAPVHEKSVTRGTQQESVRHALTGRAWTTHTPTPPRTAVGVSCIHSFTHFISFHFISFHFISFHFISFHFISFHFISFHFISFHFISFHFISFHFISFHFISFHFISFHFISFHSTVTPQRSTARASTVALGIRGTGARSCLFQTCLHVTCFSLPPPLVPRCRRCAPHC